MIKPFIRWIMPTKMRVFMADYIYEIITLIKYNILPNILFKLQELVGKSHNKYLIYFIRFPIVFFEKIELRHIKNFEKDIHFFNTDIFPFKNHEGILLMISSLTSGGSERQLVLTLLGLQKYQCSPLSSGVFFLEKPAENFYLPILIGKGIECTALDKDWEKKLEYSHIKVLESMLPIKLHDVLPCVIFLMKKKPKILHLWLDEINIKAGIAGIIVGIPTIILNTRGMDPTTIIFYKPYMLEWYRWLIQKKNVTISNNSQAGARAYEQWLKLPANTIKVIHNGFDFNANQLDIYRKKTESYRDYWGIPLRVPLVGTVTRLSEEKQPLLWLEVATKILKKLPKAHFLIIGDGPMRKEIEDFVAKAGLTKQVHIVGLYKEPLRAMAAMDIFLLTSRIEGLPNVLIEAQAVGTPVVTTHVGGASETLLHGRTGWVLEKNSPNYIAKKVTELLTSYEWLENARTEAPTFVRNRFSMDRMIKETLDIYEIH